MSFARRHDVRPRRQAGANAKARQEGAAEEAFAERRLTRALWRRVDRPDELIALLVSLPEVERALARVLLVRMLGGERARPLLGRAYGDETRAASPPPPVPAEDESGPSYSRARALRDRIVRALVRNCRAR